MSTRALVGILNDGMVTYIYNHWDGDIDGLGKTLVENYRTKETVEELLSFGDASFIEGSINSSQFYMRDKGEDGCEARSINILSYIEQDWFCDYKYCFDGEWKVMTENNKELKSVIVELEGELNDNIS